MHPSDNDLDYRALMQASRHLDPTGTTREIRIALLADAASQPLVPLLRALFHEQGVDAKIYEGPFDAIELETCNVKSGLYRFAPHVIVILNAVQALRFRSGVFREDAMAFVEETANQVSRIWDNIQSNSQATIVQSNFVAPYERPFGNFDHKVSGSLCSIVQDLNTAIVQRARGRASVLINDVEAVASWIGRRHWFDDRLWDMAKYFCSLDSLPAVAKNLVDVVMCTNGRVIKCVVLDLDNTLWGGVIGDDGLEGIQLNAHGDGEGFHRFQHYLRGLLKRGIILAVCSKNDIQNALLPFEKHPEMVLRREDIAVFTANWNDKASNIRQIRETLNIGLDSMVFLDDSPFERNLVRELLPEMIVPDLPEDPADYVREIARLNLFETAAFSEEDSLRVALYRQESERKQQQAGFASVEEYLKSLEISIHVARFDPFHMPRIAQLIQRSNQFNLTTRRLGERECESLMNDEGVIPLYAKLADRLGDYGLISVVILQPQNDEMVITDWLMSCRVLARGVEQFLMNGVFQRARELGLARVLGKFIPTAKNGMVQDFFAQFGFTKTEEDAGGQARWVLETNAYRPAPTFLTPVEPGATVAAGG
jgi:FkbH-like protein